MEFCLFRISVGDMNIFDFEFVNFSGVNKHFPNGFDKSVLGFGIGKTHFYLSVFFINFWKNRK